MQGIYHAEVHILHAGYYTDKNGEANGEVNQMGICCVHQYADQDIS